MTQKYRCSHLELQAAVCKSRNPTYRGGEGWNSKRPQREQLDSFSCRHKKLSGKVWTPLRFVTLLFRDRRVAAMLNGPFSGQNHSSLREKKPYPGCFLFVPAEKLSGKSEWRQSIAEDSDTLRHGLSLLKSKYWSFVYSQLWLSAPGLGDFIKRYQDRYQCYNLPKEAVLGIVKEFSTRLQLQFCRTNSNVSVQSHSRDLWH